MILLKIILLQIITGVVIFFVLWGLLKKELVRSALLALEQMDPRRDMAEVLVVLAVALPLKDDARLRAALAINSPWQKLLLV